MKQFFASSPGIIVIILLIIGIVLLTNWLGIGAKTSNSTSSDFPNNPKVGDTFIKGGVKYTYVCNEAQGGIVATSNSCKKFGWLTDKEILALSLIERVGICSDCSGSWQKENCPNCKEQPTTKFIKQEKSLKAPVLYTYCGSCGKYNIYVAGGNCNGWQNACNA